MSLLCGLRDKEAKEEGKKAQAFCLVFALK